MILLSILRLLQRGNGLRFLGHKSGAWSHHCAFQSIRKNSFALLSRKLWFHHIVLMTSVSEIQKLVIYMRAAICISFSPVDCTLHCVSLINCVSSRSRTSSWSCSLLPLSSLEDVLLLFRQSMWLATFGWSLKAWSWHSVSWKSVCQRLAIF